MRSISNLIFACVLLSGATPHILASDAVWPMFRGPNGSGIALDSKPPANFGPGTNLLYKVQVPPGASSPSIWGDWIFLTGLDQDKLLTFALRRSDGKLLWKQPAPAEKLELYHRTEGSPAASTPCTDGQRVYSYFGSSGLFAYDCTTGRELWAQRLPTAQHVGDFGTGTSPIVRDGIVILNRDLLHGSHISAFDARTGRQLWRQERPEFISSYSTPIIWERDGSKEVIVAGFLKMKAYDLQTGVEKWELKGLPGAACTTPVLGDGMLYFAGWSPGQAEISIPPFAQLLEKDANNDNALQRSEADPFTRQLFTYWDDDGDGNIIKEEWDRQVKKISQGENSVMAVRPPGQGKPPEAAWKHNRGLPYVPSPLYYQGILYTVKDGGMVSAYDAKTGEPFYQQERLGAPGSYYPSLVAADGKIFLSNNQGKFTILKAGKEPAVLGSFELGERFVTTPAIVENKIYLRAGDHLWAFGGGNKG